MEVSIIVTNWNGCDLLRKNLPQVVKTELIVCAVCDI